MSYKTILVHLHDNTRRDAVLAAGWALITGGSSGIGLGYANALAKAGFDLALVARSDDKLRADALQSLGLLYTEKVENSAKAIDAWQRLLELESAGQRL